MYDCVVVGGGLIGMLTARQLTQEGQSVLLLDQGSLGAESSWAGGGILSPLYPWRYPSAVSELARYSASHYQSLAADLFEESGIDPEWTQSGLLILDIDEKLQAEQWSEQFNAGASLITATKLSALEPGLQHHAEQALWLPSVAQMRNPRLVKAAAGSLRHHQVAIAEHEAVTSIEHEDGQVTAVRTAQRRIPTSRIVITAGAWSAGLLKGITTKMDVQPVRGQMLVYKAEPGLLQHIILDQDRYLIPRLDGHILIGSTLEYTGFDKSVTGQAKQELHQKALALLPGLKHFSVERHWSGLRPGTPSGIPYIGEHPDIKQLYFNTGHFRNGVILGLASVQLLTDLIQQQSPILNPVAFGLDAQH